MTENTPSEALVEAMARAIATSRGSDIVQWHHRNDAQAAATVNAEAMAAKDAQLAELRAEIEALREALGATEGAIAEYYRYWTGGEMRGSYDGKPERNGLWQALHKARQSLAGAKP